MTDLTAITTPFGLLDRETQEALKAHGGPWQVYRVGVWSVTHDPAFEQSLAYRVKPAPPKPRTIYLCETPEGGRVLLFTAIEATKAALTYGEGSTVSEWTEVLPD